MLAGKTRSKEVAETMIKAKSCDRKIFKECAMFIKNRPGIKA